MHLERISISSQPFSGLIKPHRHSELFQLLVLQTGSVQVQLEEIKLELDQPTLISLPPGLVHGFQFADNTEGYILTLALPLLLDSNTDLLASELSSEPRVISIPGEAEETRQLYALLELIRYELRYPNRDRIEMCEHLLQAILIWLARFSTQESEPDTSLRTKPLLVRFRRLIEEQYAQQRPVSDYALQLGVSASTLNRQCRSQLHQSALQLIHFRLTQEIKRRLTFTQRTLEQIATELGFDDPAYFTRFFKRQTGLTPSEYRAANNFGTQQP